MLLSGYSALLNEPELAALKAGFLDKLEGASDQTFDRTRVVAVLSPGGLRDLFLAEAYFKPGSGVGIAEAHAIAAAIQYTGSVVTPEVGTVHHGIVYALASHAVPPLTMSHGPIYNEKAQTKDVILSLTTILHLGDH